MEEKKQDIILKLSFTIHYILFFNITENVHWGFFFYETKRKTFKQRTTTNTLKACVTKLDKFF